jgi:hypothetical protein
MPKVFDLPAPPAYLNCYGNFFPVRVADIGKKLVIGGNGGPAPGRCLASFD